MGGDITLITWKPENPDEWLPIDETEMNENLSFMMDDFISSKSYLKHMPNGIMISQDRNVSKFLDTETGEFHCFGFFHSSLTRNLIA